MVLIMIHKRAISFSAPRIDTPKGGMRVYVCVCICVFIKLHITAQSGSAVLVILLPSWLMCPPIHPPVSQ